MDTIPSTAVGTDNSAVITIKPPKSAKLRAWHEESLQLLEKIKLRRARSAALQEEYREAILKEKNLPEEKKFDVLSFCTQEQRKRRYRETILNVIGKR